MAYETLPREIVGWRFGVLLVWIGLAGAVVSQLPTEWVGEEGGWWFWALLLTGSLIQYGLASLAMTLRAHRRAARRRPRPSEVEIVDHLDRLEWREGGATEVIPCLAMEAILTAPAHVFVRVEGRVLIFPLRAFRDRDGMVAFATELERRRDV
ncbi:hypothetical protein [Methylobacterium sp. Leaf118]|uniref:hypothetical protein n=1 Tax=Methylobacterium sp. Leaf118 TaxID=2876562 RepID=UPI001E599D09|nr:hypothetical protein [Methylobacterium sp. Leaf118]